MFTLLIPLWFCLPSSSVGWYVNTATTGGANSYWNPLKSPTGSNLAPWSPLALYIQSDRFVNFTPFIQQQGHQYKCMTGKYAPKQLRMNFFAFAFFPTFYRSDIYSASGTKRGDTSCPSRVEWRRWSQDEWWWPKRWSQWVTSGSIKTASSRTR